MTFSERQKRIMIIYIYIYIYQWMTGVMERGEVNHKGIIQDSFSGL